MKFILKSDCVVNAKSGRRDGQPPRLDPDEVRKNDELCIKNENFCIKDEKLCTKNEELCIKDEELCIKEMTAFAESTRAAPLQSSPSWTRSRNPAAFAG